MHHETLYKQRDVRERSYCISGRRSRSKDVVWSTTDLRWTGSVVVQVVEVKGDRRASSGLGCWTQCWTSQSASMTH